MRYFIYKTFTWTVVILTALIGTALTSFLLGALGMYSVLEKGESMLVQDAKLNADPQS